MESLKGKGNVFLIPEKKLGLENAERVLKAFSKDSQHFGFVKISKEELAELTALPSPSKMALAKRDVFCFRAGIWMIVIIVHEHDYVEVTIVNPYALPYAIDENFTTSDI